MKPLTLTTLSALLLIALTAAPAAAGPRFRTSPDATLYEVTENMSVDNLGVRTALAALQGTAKVGSPLCPEAVVAMFGGESCTITAIGRDEIRPGAGGMLTGEIWGEFAVVVNVEQSNPVDAPEAAVMTGTFQGDITADGVLPIIAIHDGVFVADPNGFGVTVASFSGVFRLPFTVSSRGRFEKPGRNGPAFYLTDDGKKERVKNEEYSLGWPTVRVEVMFDPAGE
jgi:hypothetical protein